MGVAVRKKEALNWPLAITGMLMMALVYVQLINLSSVFVEACSEDLGVSRVSFSVHQTIGLVMCIVASFSVGWLIQKFNIKKVLAITAILAAACSFLYSLATNVKHFYLISAIMGLCVIILGSPSISILINNCFPEKYRGRAMGLAMCGSGLGATLLSPVVSMINTRYSWRWSYRLMGMLVILIVLPMILVNVKSSMQPSTQDTAKGHKVGSGLIRSGFFLYVLFLIISAGFVFIIINSAGYTYFCEIGFSYDTASLIFSFMSASLLVGKLTLGVICDKIGNKKGIFLSLIVHTASMFLFVLAKRIPWFVVPGILTFGIGNAWCSVGVPLLIIDMFGTENYADVGGPLFSGVFIGNCVGPLFVSYIYDATGSYVPALLIAGIANLLIIPAVLAGYMLSSRKHSDNKNKLV